MLCGMFCCERLEPVHYTVHCTQCMSCNDALMHQHKIVCNHQGTHPAVSSIGLSQRSYFPFNDWLKGATQQRIALGQPGQPGANASCTYRVSVTTSDIRGAGTDADVVMVLYGDKGDTGERRLESSANDFERGQVSDKGGCRVVRLAAWWQFCGSCFGDATTIQGFGADWLHLEAGLHPFCKCDVSHISHEYHLGCKL